MFGTEVKAITHSDKTTNILRWVAFGAVGLYLWRVNKQEGKQMGSENPNNFSLDIDLGRAVDTAFEVIPPLRNLNPMVQVGVKEFIKGFDNERKGKHE